MTGRSCTLRAMGTGSTASSGEQLPSGFLSVGQDVARALALRAARGDRLAAPLLVHGMPGSGKRAFVADLVALLVCAACDPDTGPCNRCVACRQARAGIHVDVVIASPDSWRTARSGGESIVAVARRWLLDIAGAPIRGERRVAVIEDADRCNEQIQNALLKVLEEPSERHQFVLVADDAQRLLPTIRSRSQSLRIGPVPRGQLARWLMERYLLPADQADALARLSGGRSGLAASFVDRTELLDWRRRLQIELLALLERGRAERFGSARDVIEEASRLGVDATLPVTAEEPPSDGPARTPAAVQRLGALAVADVWLALARDLLVSAGGHPTAALSADLLPDLPAAATRIGPAEIGRFILRLERIREGLLQNLSPRLAMEVAMLEWPSLPAAAG